MTERESKDLNANDWIWLLLNGLLDGDKENCPLDCPLGFHRTKFSRFSNSLSEVKITIVDSAKEIISIATASIYKSNTIASRKRFIFLWLKTFKWFLYSSTKTISSRISNYSCPYLFISTCKTFIATRVF